MAGDTGTCRGFQIATPLILTSLLTSECHGHHHQDKCQGIMALYHFKKDVINSNKQSNSSNSSNNSGNLFQQNDSNAGKSGAFPLDSNSPVFPSNSNSSAFSSNSQSQFNCRNCQQRSDGISAMLNRVNLRDVLRETISNEMRSIMRENGQNYLRFEGS